MSVIITRPIGGGGGGLIYGTIGLPSDGFYSDGIVDLTPGMSVANALDAINEYLLQQGVRRYGIKSIPSGADFDSILFSPPYSGTDYTINLTLVNKVDFPPSIYSFIASSVTPSGFSVIFSGDMDSNNYEIHWETINGK